MYFLFIKLRKCPCGPCRVLLLLKIICVYSLPLSHLSSTLFPSLPSFHHFWAQLVLARIRRLCSVSLLCFSVCSLGWLAIGSAVYCLKFVVDSLVSFPFCPIFSFSLFLLSFASASLHLPVFFKHGCVYF